MHYEEFVKMDQQGASHWWYAARRNLLLQALKKECPVPGNLKILDVASACGDNFAVGRNYGTLFGLDISWQSIHYCKKKNISTIVQADVQQMPYKSNSFDIVLALDIFEHLKDDSVSLWEISRVLRKTGKLIFNTPACMALFSYHDEAFQHVRRYSARELRSKMASANLEVIRMSHWSFFIFPFVYLHRKLRIRKQDAGTPLSDFHTEINPAVAWVLARLAALECVMIKSNFSLPFGVSIFGVARKSL